MPKEKEDEVGIDWGSFDKNNGKDMLRKWEEITLVKQSLMDYESGLKDELKAFLKERHWDRLDDRELKLSAVLVIMSRENIDKKALGMILSDGQINTVLRIIKYEQLTLVSPKVRDKLKQEAR